MGSERSALVLVAILAAACEAPLPAASELPEGSRVAVAPAPSPSDTSAGAAAAIQLPRGMELHFRSLFRRDALDWNIAGDGDVDVLSELTWRGLQSRGIEAGWNIELPSRLVAFGRASFGWIHDGSNQDSDFAGPDRSLEFSRSNNAASAGSTLEASAALGYRLPEGLAGLRWTPVVGLAYQRQNLRIQDGVQTIPDDGPFGGLDSHYDAAWFGPWLGLQVDVAPHPRWNVNAGVEYHGLVYRGVANWNLRDDFDHPVSFRHRAYGTGLVLNTSLSWQMTRRWTLDLTGRWLDYVSRPGRDTVYFSDGEEASTRLNAVHWRSQQVVLGASYSF